MTFGGFFAQCKEVMSNPDDSVQVRIRLRRESYHKIKLQHVPAACKDGLCRVHEVGVGHCLVDNAAKAFSACFRCEGESGLAHACNCPDHIRCESSDSERRERDRDAAFPISVD